MLYRRTLKHGTKKTVTKGHIWYGPRDTTSTGKYKEPERKLVVSCGLCGREMGSSNRYRHWGQGNAIN